MRKGILFAVTLTVVQVAGAWGQAPRHGMPGMPLQAWAPYFPPPNYAPPYYAPPAPMIPMAPPPWAMRPAYPVMVAPGPMPPVPGVLANCPSCQGPAPAYVPPVPAPLPAPPVHHMPEPAPAVCQEVCPAPVCPDRPPPADKHHRRCLYGKAEGLYWWVQDQPSPTFLAVGTGTVAAPVLNTLIGDGSALFATDGTLIGFLDGNLNLPGANLSQYGGRATLGFWLDAASTVALEGNFLYLAPRSNAFVATSTGAELIVVHPESDTLVAIAGSGVAGSATVSTWTSIIGAEGNLRKELYRGSCAHFDMLLGFRWLQMHENLNLTTTSDATALTTTDFFGTQNHFFGGQFGLEGEVSLGRWFIGVWGKIALGSNRQRVDISGSTATAAGVLTSDVGIITDTTNIGSYEQSSFSMLSEAGLNVGFRITEHCRIYGGYTILYMTNAVRPASQIDVTNDSPLFNFNETNFWIQGLQAGLEFRY